MKTHARMKLRNFEKKMSEGLVQVYDPNNDDVGAFSFSVTLRRRNYCLKKKNNDNNNNNTNRQLLHLLEPMHSESSQNGY